MQKKARNLEKNIVNYPLQYISYFLKCFCFSIINNLIFDKVNYLRLIQYPKQLLSSFNSKYLGIEVISNNSFLRNANILFSKLK